MIAQAEWILSELERWRGMFERGELSADGLHPLLGPGERFAVRVGGVRAAGLGHPAASGTLLATDSRLLLVGRERDPLREWRLDELVAVDALGNWGGLALVHAGGDTELVVTARREPPTWDDAIGWLEVEAAHAAATGQLALWDAALQGRLAPSWMQRATNGVANPDSLEHAIARL